MGAISKPGSTNPSYDVKCPGNRIASLPAELLLQIFESVCERPTMSANFGGRNIPSFSTPLFLGKICGQWRDLAWSIPSLWNYIDLVLPTTKQSVCAELLADWLDRSKHLPLTIIFRRDEYAANAARNWGEQTLPLFHLISSEWQRWEHIDLFIPHHFCTSRINLKCNRLSLLHTAVIRGIGGPAFPDSFLGDGPSLRELTIHMTKFQPPTNPYFQLTRLNASAMAMDDVIDLLAHAPNLQELYLADIGNSPATNLDFKILLLENLTSLSIINSRSLPDFLNNLHTPRLLHLHLEGCARVPVEVPGIHPFIEIHGPQLQTLVLGGFWEQCIAPLLVHTPRLRELGLRRDGTRGASEFEESLAQCLEGLSSLQCFSLFGVAGPCYPILDVIKKRWVVADQPKSDSACSSTDISTRIHTLGFSSSIDSVRRIGTKNYLRDEISDGMTLDFIDWVGGHVGIRTPLVATFRSAAKDAESKGALTSTAELYRVVRSGNGRVVPPLYKDGSTRHDEEGSPLDLERIQHFGPWVHHVLLYHPSVDEVTEILSVCPNVHNLALSLWVIRDRCAPLFPVVARLPLRRHSLYPAALLEHYEPNTGMLLDQLSFRELTHLELFAMSASWDRWRQLALLPRVTHLAMHSLIVRNICEWRFVDTMLAECLALEVLALFYRSVYELEEFDTNRKDPPPPRRVAEICG